MSLLYEYNKRKKTNCLWTVNNGIACLDDEQNAPHSIYFINAYPRVWQSCGKCHKTNNLALETIVPNRDALWTIQSHTHISCDLDLRELLEKNNLILHPIKNQEELLSWMVEFAIVSSGIQNYLEHVKHAEKLCYLASNFYMFYNRFKELWNMSADRYII